MDYGKSIHDNSSALIQSMADTITKFYQNIEASLKDWEPQIKISHTE